MRLQEDTQLAQEPARDSRWDSTRPLRVVLVEDDADDYVIVRDTLAEVEGWIYELDWVRTFEEGRRAIEADEYDAYLLDYRLGSEDGLGLVELASQSVCRGAVILLTGQGSLAVDLRAMHTGATDYLVKGEITPALLDRSIRYGVERTAMIQSLARKSIDLETMNRTLEDRERLMAVLLRIGKVTLNSLDLHEVLDTLVRELVEGSLLPLATISVVRTREAEVETVRSARRDAERGKTVSWRLSRSRPIDGPGVLCAVVRSGQLTIVAGDDPSLDPEFDLVEGCRGELNYFVPVRRDGESMAVLTTATPRRDREQMMRTLGQMAPLLDQAAIALDHAVKTRDLKEAQANLVQAEKMSSLGQLVAGVAHEINNPAGFVYSGLQSLRELMADLKVVLKAYGRCAQALGDGQDQEVGLAHHDLLQVLERIDLPLTLEEIDEIVEDSNEGMERVTGIVHSLKEFARRDDGLAELVDVNAGVNNTLRLLWNELKYKCEVITQLGELPKIRCNPGQLNQVFMNLLINAAQATPERGKITVETAVEDRWIVVRIADTGIGIPEGVIHRIFEPFFTTKKVGEGTGLGLAISFRIVQAHKGRIDVQSEVGVGTVFTVRIPTDLQEHNDKGGLAHNGKGDE